MAADTAFTLTGEFQSTLGKGLSIAVANLSTTGQVVTVTLRSHNTVDQVVILRGSGDSVAQSGDVYASADITASSYPCTISLAILPGTPPLIGVIGAAVTQGTTLLTMRQDYYYCNAAHAFPIVQLANVKSIMVKADPTNTAYIMVSQSFGSSNLVSDWPLAPGEVFRADAATPLTLRNGGGPSVGAIVWQGA